MSTSQSFRICWDTSLVASFEHHTFGHGINSDCRNIEPVTAKANIREYLSYDIDRGDLIIHTNASETNELEDAIVEVKATELPEGAKNGTNSMQIHQTFVYDLRMFFKTKIYGCLFLGLTVQTRRLFYMI